MKKIKHEEKSLVAKLYQQYTIFIAFHELFSTLRALTYTLYTSVMKLFFIINLKFDSLWDHKKQYWLYFLHLLLQGMQLQVFYRKIFSNALSYCYTIQAMYINKLWSWCYLMIKFLTFQTLWKSAHPIQQ